MFLTSMYAPHLYLMFMKILKIRFVKNTKSKLSEDEVYRN